MRRFLSCAAFLVAASLAPLTSALAAGPSPSPAPPSGSLYVTTLPTGAEVYVDGTYVGRSPVLVDALGGGRHGLTTSKTGYVLRETQVVVSAGSVTFEDERLDTSSASGEDGSVVVRGAADDARVFFDGAPVSAKGPFAARAGAHRLTIESGRARTTRPVTVFPETTTQVLVRDAVASEAGHPSAAVVAPLDEWLPDAALSIAGKKIVLRYEGHRLDGRLGDAAMRVDGETVSYLGSPEMIGGKLYLPLGVLERLAGSVVRAAPKK